MFTKGTLMFLYTESLVHPGAGEGVGAIDLPIQRERITNWPVIQASGLKGAVRECFENKITNQDELFVVFGPDQDKMDSNNNPGNPADNAGAVSFGDAKVLLFPVRSLKGTFAYLTCPLALTRLRRDLESLSSVCGANLIDQNFQEVQNLETHPIGDDTIVVTSQGTTNLGISTNHQHKVVLEEYAFQVTDNNNSGESLHKLSEWLDSKWTSNAPWMNLNDHLCLVSNDVFKDFLEMSTEVLTRNKIDDATGTVQTGALWNEECLPRETLLYAPLLVCHPFKAGGANLKTDGELLDFLTNQSNVTPDRIWLGGGLTIGRGAMRTHFI